MIKLDLDRLKFLECCYKKKYAKDRPTYPFINNNFERSWNFLKQTHKLQDGECLCLRSLCFNENKWDKYCYSQELVLYDFSKKSYTQYKRWLRGKCNAESRIYNFYYGTYNININAAKEECREKGKGFFGKKVNASSLSMLILDFDNFELEDYLKLKNDLKERGLDGTIDLMSGHGFHIIFRLSKNYEDEYLLLKMIKIFQSLGYNPDTACQDAARVMRLPFFYNSKLEKGKSVMAEIICGETDNKEFTVEEVFEKLGFDYNTFYLDSFYSKDKKKVGRPKKVEPTEKKKVEIEEKEIDLEEKYGSILNLFELPDGIKNMLRGFVPGYSNLQTLVLTLYFKSKNLKLETIQDILNITESINTNKWNYWITNNEVERFYNNYNYINKYTLLECEEKFGEINFYDNNRIYKIPVGMLNPSDLRLYTYLLINKNKRKKDILKDLNISNNTLDKILKDSIYFGIKDKIYYIKDFEFTYYIKVDKEFLNKILKMTKNQSTIYCCLYYKIGIRKDIQTSILSIKNFTFLSESSIKTTLKELEKNEYIKIQRSHYSKIKENKECNIYKLLK